MFQVDRKPKHLDVSDASGRKKRFIVGRHPSEIEQAKSAFCEKALDDMNQEHGPGRQLPKAWTVSDKSVGDNLSFNPAEGVGDWSIKMK